VSTPSVVSIRREAPDGDDVRALIAELDAELEPLYGSKSRHGYTVDKLLAEHVAFFIVRLDGDAAGCGGVKIVEPEYGEIKRMYLRPRYRGRGLARALLDELTAYVRECGVPALRLETGIYQAAAIALYEREGFRRIPPFANYTDDPVSRCYEKLLG
jgi:ribosomal protein S18 acetylase RimI-like enzyme